MSSAVSNCAVTVFRRRRRNHELDRLNTEVECVTVGSLRMVIAGGSGCVSAQGRTEPDGVGLSSGQHRSVG